ncbi:DNA polymerase III subunit alpha [Fulvivirga sp. M361]|uniref:DNA polymerase III subunit alpha n=1 Tax=Fulvivirga sp. M361 TaxID=2594266 RepID=UPI00117B36B4|nr:DNA polymerase III subunit alpha [Fulvivirga sp. M361]TRX51294.1 DNA polymerase III subunit alpha [Fulvivirga sp. M361]
MYLNTHTYYSFKYGTLSVKELLAEAMKYELGTLVLTDINSTAACLSFVRLAEKHNIRPVLGIDFREGTRQQFVGIAQNNEGFKELNDYLSRHLHAKHPITTKAPAFHHSYIIYPFHIAYNKDVILRDNEFLGVTPHDLNKLKFSKWKDRLEKLVVLQTVTFRNKRDFNAHRLLRAIDNNTLLSKLSKSEEGNVEHRMLPVPELAAIYEGYPEIIENTRQLLHSCSIDFEFGDEYPHKNKKTYTDSEEEDYRLICKLCDDGMSYRYGDPGNAILDRLKKELEIIREKGFISYFLINWDIINYARSQGYFYVGRGSGANSIVAYLLKITDVDPIELDLYFERFINLYRKNPPDFDIDFSWRDREDITRYIFERFDHVALLATYSTFQFRAVVRELGKVFGLPPHEIDRLAGGNASKNDKYSQLVLRYAQLIHGFPSHLSIHAGGILISEKPLHYYTATDLPPKGYPTTHFDMIIAEDVGLYKFDILSQRGLGKIKDTLAIIPENNPEALPIDIHDMKRFKCDPAIKHLLKEAKAIGCFYVESPAMRMLLKKLRADDYMGLVAASSIIRPGVAKSGMMREYILRFRQPERRKDAHPVMLNIMPDTFGVMVYQEDVIKVAHYFADLTLAEADVLRRGMSGKFRSREEFRKVRRKYFENCRKKGYPDELAAEIWRQIESFAGYAFSKGHSASYAVESYQSLFLKAYYPLEYMVATINNFGGFYRTELYVHEARMHGGTIVPPCVNKSSAQTCISGTHIYLGFNLIKELEHKIIEQFETVRTRDGVFQGLEDFVNRVSISLEQLILLIRVGGFAFTGNHKKELLWRAHFLLGNGKTSDATPHLFDIPVKRLTLPKLSFEEIEDAFDEMTLLGFPLCSPFELLKKPLKSTLCVGQLPAYLGNIVTIVGYLIVIKNTNTSKGQRMYFGTFLDLEGHFIDTVHFPPEAIQYPFRGKGVYTITGKVVEEFGYHTIEVTAMEKELYMTDPRYSEESLTQTLSHR